MNILDKIPSYLKNKYAVTAIVFFIWLFFFDQNNIISQISYRIELSKLEADKEYYEQEIKKTVEDLEELKTNPKTLEKFAREKYLMKKENEELFVIVRERD